MICSECGKESRVISTVKKNFRVFRERKCKGCGRKWYTEEVENNSVMVASALSNRNKWREEDWDNYY